MKKKVIKKLTYTTENTVGINNIIVETISEASAPDDLENGGDASIDSGSEEDESTRSSDPISLSLDYSDGVLNGDNKLWCLHCLQYTEASLSKRLENLPPILTFHVERFRNWFVALPPCRSFRSLHYMCWIACFFFQLFKFKDNESLQYSSKYFLQGPEEDIGNRTLRISTIRIRYTYWNLYFLRAFYLLH